MSEWNFVAPLETRSDYDSEVRAAAIKYDVDPDLAVAVHRREYSPKRWASTAGARGPMQLMPKTAQDLGVNPDDPIQNIDGGVRYLKQQLKAQGGNIPLALASYNAGPGAVAKHGGIPPYAETQEYVKNITERYKKLKGTQSGVAYAGDIPKVVSEPDEFEYVGPLDMEFEKVGELEPEAEALVSDPYDNNPMPLVDWNPAPVIQAVAPVAGAVGGAVLASPGGPPAMVAGGALGYGAGKQLSNVIAEARGTRERPPTGQALIEAGKDLAVGGMLSLPGGAGVKAIPQAISAGLSYGASQEAERAYSEGTGESAPLPTGEALIGSAKNVGMGTAMAVPFSFLPWAANAHAEKQAKTAQKELDATIDKISRKAFMSGVAGQKTAAQIDKYSDKMNFVIKDITANKTALNITNAEGAEVAGQLPQTRREMIQAVSQGKQRIFDQFDAMAKQAGQEGILIDPEPIAKEILKLSQTKAVNIANPTAIAYAEKMAERLMNSGPLTPKEAQSVIAAFNDKLSAFYGNPSFADVSNIAVDAVAVGQLRKSLDDAITSVSGPGYQELKNAYGAYSTIERDVARAAVTGARAAPKGLVDFFDIVTAHQGAMALIHLSPAALVSAGTMGAIKHYFKNLNNRDKMVSKMFGKVDEALTKQAANEIKAPFVPGGGELPASLQADIATLDKELAGMADNERRQVLAEVYKMYNMDQKLLPAGQTFEMLNTPQSSPYSPELAGSLKGALALPPGQGFKVLEESQRKSQQELRSDLFGIGSPKTPPASTGALTPEPANIQSLEMPTEAKRIIELAKEAIAKRKAATAKADFEALRDKGVRTEMENKVITPDGKTQKQVDNELVAGLKAEMEARKAAKVAEKPEYEISSTELPSIFHGGKTKIKKINDSKLQSRDYGFYGEGFYGASTRNATKGYGGRITEFTVSPDAKILKASLKASDAPKGLVDEIKAHLESTAGEAAKARGKYENFKVELANLENSPIEWKNAVDRFAKDKGYDAVMFSDGEIVFKNTSVLSRPNPNYKGKKTLDKSEIKEDNGLTQTSKGEKPMKVEPKKETIQEMDTRIKEEISRKKKIEALDEERNKRLAEKIATKQPSGAQKEYKAADAEFNAKKESRISEIKSEFEKLQKQYEAKMNKKGRNSMVPPPIKSDILKGIAKKMDKLEAELKKLKGD